MLSPALSPPPLAHIDDPHAVTTLLQALRALHGQEYEFAVGHWDGTTALEPRPDWVIHRFVIAAEQATVELHPGEWVRGAPADAPYTAHAAGLAQVAAAHTAALWPGDVLCLHANDAQGTRLHGAGIYFDVLTAVTGYRAPRLVLLRNLTSKPGGCAAYPNAFRREALPPARPMPESQDRRGVNRVNEHTLDMRVDRTPPPIPHYHGPVPVGPDRYVNHSETALVLPRAVYGLPELGRPDQGEVVIYRRPAQEPGDKMTIPVRPGSIIVTPATAEQVMGHAFRNCFAMLVAIPGFVAPYHVIGEE